MVHFSLFYILMNGVYVGFALLAVKKEQFEVVPLGSGKIYNE